MQALLTDIELDIQELKCLMDVFSREPNTALRGVLRRSISQMRVRLDELLLQIDSVLPSSPILAERITTASDLRHSISLNDSFRFSRELFHGDSEQMNRILQQIGEMSSYDLALSFLTAKVEVGEENEALADLAELLKKYFN